MKLLPIFLLLSGCPHAGGPAAAAAAVPRPPSAAVARGEDGEKARAAFASGFLAAVAKGDEAAIDAYTDPRDLCAAEAAGQKVPASSLDKCVQDLGADNRLGIEACRQALPASFTAGGTEGYPIDARQGVYMVVVHPAQGGPESGLGIIILEYRKVRYVVFPVKK